MLAAAEFSRSNVLDQVEEWVAATGTQRVRKQGAAEEAAGGAVTLSVTDALLPELCELRWFGSAGILTLATTCKTYAIGLKHEVRRATAIVVWRPSYSDVLQYIARYVAKTDISCHVLRCLLSVSDDDDDDDMPEGSLT